MRFYKYQIVILCTMTTWFESTGLREDHIFKKLISVEERDDFGEGEVGLEETQHGGAALFGGQGLAGKETLPTGRTEASDLPQCVAEYSLVTRVSEWHVTGNTEAARTSSEAEDASLHFSLGGMMAFLAGMRNQ